MKADCLGFSFLGLGLIAVVALTGYQHMSLSASRTDGSSNTPISSGLIYRNTGALWIMGDDGKVQLLAHHEAALPSPDLTQAVYDDQTHEDMALWVIDLETQKERHVATDRSVVHLFGWMDGDTLLLGTTHRAEALEGGHHFGHLTALATGTGEVRVLDLKDLCASLPAASPDGERVAYSTFRGARLAERNGEPQALDTASFAQLSHIKDLSLTSAAWSPDGQRLAWIGLGRFGDTDDTDDREAAVIVLDTHSHTAQILHRFLPLRYGDLIAASAWSPDGRWLALVAITHEGTGAGTWLIAADGSQEYPVTKSTMTGPFWTPQGQLVWNDDGVWLLEPGSRIRRNVLPPGHGYAVGWTRL